jgi:5-methylcytosine-specific restriction protein B
MNTADRSIGLIDAALRRRFHFVPFFPEEGALEGLLRRWLEDTQAPDLAQVADWVDRLNELLRERFGRHLQIGHSYFMQETLELSDIDRIWKTDILPFLEDQLMEQVADLQRFTLAAIKDGLPPQGDDEFAESDGDDDRVVYADDNPL